MTNRKTTPIQIKPPSISQAQAIKLLQRQIDAGNKLLSESPLSKDNFDAWESMTKDFLIKSFGSQSDHINEVINIGKYGSYPMSASAQYLENRRRGDLTSKIKMLESLIGVLQTELELFTEHSEAEQSQLEIRQNGRSIFIVHGHDDSIIHEVARFLSSLELSVTILREQPNEGRTIIEKFEDFSNVDFAVVLLTPDDIGGIKDAPIEEMNYRARQNVILELGYFLGKLGRNRVCSLYNEGVEIPSDFSGVIFTLLDKKGSWKFDLAREIKASGISIDLNLVI